MEKRQRAIRPNYQLEEPGYKSYTVNKNCVPHSSSIYIIFLRNYGRLQSEYGNNIYILNKCFIFVHNKYIPNIINQNPLRFDNVDSSNYTCSCRMGCDTRKAVLVLRLLFSPNMKNSIINVYFLKCVIF
ncbi:hypothetical protein EDEG_00632 [Edhazardia aedis USNM 41457]|uniref:Uncharacterized protein n=1 Tax=Edhazardia aedis (strain USNM 41457) TaxID=1003232 RepID=J9DCY0_EDHAE|nr:hypothetical protein EDEG_00632 [Edhazardia aedis USNM 41457]|eukprot:EJW05329.1 hypothetical protein EDEG_00632 [Edhazardia aedis USNM 41457]